MRKVRRPSPSYDYDSDGSYQSGKSGNSLAPPRPRRRSPGPTTHQAGSLMKSSIFQKFLLLLIAVVLFDVVFLWDYFGGLDENADGPEAGMHHLHASRRMGNVLLQATAPRLNLEKPAGSVDHSYLDRFSDGEKVEMLEHEVEAWRKKYEEAMVRAGENPYLQAPFTPVPPNAGNDDGARRHRASLAEAAPIPKKTRAELDSEETYGADAHIVKILHAARVEIDEELAGQLPTWDDVVSLYGATPIIHGLDTCASYREAVLPKDRMTGPAGMFNTGTNLLFELLKVNCDIKEAREMQREPRKNGMRWQVPWGKHNPPTTHRFENVAKAWGRDPFGTLIKQDDFLPVVLIKDPYTWMGSQCRHKYATFWGHDNEHCPNLIRWKITEEDVPSEVRVKYALQMKMYESLLDMWNHWYREWEEQTFPHLATRFEDLLFHGEEVTRAVCDCVGGVFTDSFQYVEDSAKPAKGVHTGANGLVKAMLQYGNPGKRLNGFTDRDLRYASKTVAAELTKRYSYTAPPLPT